MKGTAVLRGATRLAAAIGVVCATAAAAPAFAQSDLEKLVAAAKKDGSLVVSHFTDAAIEPILRKFEQKFGVKVEASAGRPSSVIPKLLTEQKNGQYNWDILLQPVNNVRLVLEPAGGLEPILPFLVLPEVKNPDNWYGGLTAKIPMEPLYMFYDGIASPGAGMQVNRDKLSRAQLNDWPDLLKPEFKGKFGIYHPGRLATLTVALACYRPAFATQKAWEDYVTAFFAQKPVAARQFRTVADWLVKGRFDVVVAAGSTYLNGLAKKLERNIEDPVGDQRCGNPPDGTGRTIAVVKNPPHRNAATLFVNWYLTKDVQEEIVRGYWKTGEESVSRRKDAGHPDPAFQQKAIKGFHDDWLSGKGLMTTSDEGLALQKKVVAIGKAAGY